MRFTQRGKCHELDFVVGNALLDGALALVQVTTTMDDEITAHRELIALNSAMERLEVEEGTMVTLDECRDTQTDHGIVHVVLAWE